MQPEISWTRTSIDHLDGTARVARWHLDQVAEQRVNITPVWNDACALSVGQRYLDPLTEEAANALASVGQASRDLHACADGVQRAEEHFATAAALGRSLQGTILESQSLLRATGELADNAVLLIDSARQQIARAQSLLSQADAGR